MSGTSSDDEMQSSGDSSNVELSEQRSDSDEHSDSDEMEVVGLVESYADEPLAHSSDSEEDNETDQDGLSPAVLRARFLREVPINEWLVYFT